MVGENLGYVDVGRGVLSAAVAREGEEEECDGDGGRPLRAPSCFWKRATEMASPKTREGAKVESNGEEDPPPDLVEVVGVEQVVKRATCSVIRQRERAALPVSITVARTVIVRSERRPSQRNSKAFDQPSLVVMTSIPLHCTKNIVRNPMSARRR